MKIFSVTLVIASVLFSSASFATVWESKKELPVGAACPSQAKEGDDVAFQVNGNGGYVCFSCEYALNPENPNLIVTRQVRCNKQIKCKRGTCR